MALAAGILLMPLAGCNDDKSYSDMLREEEIAVNWYLAKTAWRSTSLKTVCSSPDPMPLSIK